MPAATPPLARSTFTVIFAAAFSAATNASGDGVPPSKTVNARSPIVLLKPSRNSGPRPVSTPSDSQAISPAPVAVGIRNQFVRGLDPDVPARGRAPAVVEQDDKRSAIAGKAGVRIPDRSRGRQDHERRGCEPQRRQPPWCMRRGFFLRRDVQQQPRRRKLNAPRPRRHHPQQPPQHGQAQQTQQQKWFGERERQPCDHALRPALTVAKRALPLLAIMPLCRNRSSSAAERLVVWIENSQSSLLVSLRISSR